MAPKSNPESWQTLRDAVTGYPDDAIWAAWKTIARDIVWALESRGLSECFHARMTMNQIRFSTAPGHPPGRDGPVVAFEIHPMKKLVRVVLLGDGGSSPKLILEEICPSAAAVQVLIKYLQKSWQETKPGVQLPTGLKET